MLRLVSFLASVALTIVVLPAASAERVELPAEMLGDWCLQQEDEVLIFRRDDCLDRPDNWLLIGREYQSPQSTIFRLRAGLSGNAFTS
jgi:hypothetical protein